ncbi:unnamed protein product [Chrysodeixis includens]|uniref:Uncharacterized protein n=1 Tax=Chrysodeixis includens TaxID=689277 RepID=A0A9P0G0L5_CHRIL|nr:unnamed protein product [Chrysodeixis includens]
MRTELPEFKRCCFCVPLRYGLLTWGYLKLLSTCLLLLTYIGALYVTVRRVVSDPIAVYYYEEITVFSIVIVVLTIDASLTTVFIVGGHQKNSKLLRVFYIYGIVILVLLFIMLSIMIVPMLFEDSFTPSHIKMYIIDMSGILIEILLQIYFLLLLRSEIVKLNANCEFRFVNNAAQGECVMKYKDNLDDKAVDEELKKEIFVSIS